MTTDETAVGKVALVLLPMEPGRKTRHLALIRHRGGGWYEVACMGEGKRCRAGECRHTRNMRWEHSPRAIRQVARDA